MDKHIIFVRVVVIAAKLQEDFTVLVLRHTFLTINVSVFSHKKVAVF